MSFSFFTFHFNDLNIDKKRNGKKETYFLIEQITLFETI